MKGVCTFYCIVVCMYTYMYDSKSITGRTFFENTLIQFKDV